MAVTQQQIAELAGVSRGTVYRALNNSGPVKPEVAVRIRRIAEELGYRPNRAGRLLVRANRPLKLAVIIQSTETDFMANICDLIEAAQPQFADLGAEVVVFPTTKINVDHQLELLDKIQADGFDGLALTPAEDERICDRIDELVNAGIPVVTFNTDIAGTRRLCYVGQDSYQAGRTCAGLMAAITEASGEILMITGHLSNRSHQRRIDGFRFEIRESFPNLITLPLERGNDDQEQAYRIVVETLKEHPRLRGIYASANGQAGISRALRDTGMKDQVRFICHDLTEENTANLNAGLIDFLVDQDARSQAIRPLEILINHLLSDTIPAEEFQLTKIEIYNRYNL